MVGHRVCLRVDDVGLSGSGLMALDVSPAPMIAVILGITRAGISSTGPECRPLGRGALSGGCAHWCVRFCVLSKAKRPSSALLGLCCFGCGGGEDLDVATIELMDSSCLQ